MTARPERAPATTPAGDPLRGKRRYYDRFSAFYDGFVRLHSCDRQGRMRDFLVEVADPQPGEMVLDLCTGTGACALRLSRSGARLLGIDFSGGMLRQARRKAAGRCGIHWVQADARALPVASGTVDCVTCAYAMYELAAGARRGLLAEVARVLRPAGRFVMMEHLPPRGRFLRLLYRLRVRLLASEGVGDFVGGEEEEFGRTFDQVRAFASGGGLTKAVIGRKPVPGSGRGAPAAAPASPVATRSPAPARPHAQSGGSP